MSSASQLEPLGLLYAGGESRSVVLWASALCHAVTLCVTHSMRAAGTLRCSALLKKGKQISWLEESGVPTLWCLAPHIWHSKWASEQMCWHDCLVRALSVFSATCTFFFFFFTHTSVVVTARGDNGGTISPPNTADRQHLPGRMPFQISLSNNWKNNWRKKKSINTSVLCFWLVWWVLGL